MPPLVAEAVVSSTLLIRPGAPVDPLALAPLTPDGLVEPAAPVPELPDELLSLPQPIRLNAANPSPATAVPRNAARLLNRRRAIACQ